MTLYVDYMKGRSKWELCSLDDVDKIKTEDDFFITWQRYCNKYHGEYGECYGNCVFDFDHEKDISIAKKDCLRVYGILTGKGILPENIRIYFSGNKGFHLEIDYRAYMKEPVFDIHLIYKEIYKYIERLIKPEKNKSTMDSSIYSIRRMWRYPNTRHSKTGLYCVPITYEELIGKTEDIIKIANNKRNIKYIFVDDPKMRAYFRESMTAHWKNCDEFEKKQSLIKDYMGDVPPCIKKIFNESIPRGVRNKTIYLLARFYKDKEEEEKIYEMLLALASKNYGPDEKNDLKGMRSTIRSALNRPGNFLSCESFFYYCDKKNCDVFDKKISQNYSKIVEDSFNIYTYEDALSILEADLKSGSLSRVMKTGITQLDSKTKVLRDSVVAIGALSDVGKTAFAITIASFNSEKKILYLAIEEGLNRTTLRLNKALIKSNINTRIITGKIGTITADKIYALCYMLSGKFDFVIIDQLSNLNESADEERIKYKKIMEKLREIAREFERPIFLLHQLSRAALREDEPRKEHFAEGADIERLSHDVWLLYRKRIDGVLYNLLKIDKNKNYKKEINIPLVYDSVTGTFKDYEVFDIDWNFFEKKLNIDKNEYFFGKVDETIEFTRCK